MKLGLSIGYSKAQMDLPVALVQRAEALGYDSVWSAEAYGSDAVTPLAFLAAVTKRIRLGTGIMQLAARTPANAAMCAGTIDALAGGGRFIAGLGVGGIAGSGPQIRFNRTDSYGMVSVRAHPPRSGVGPAGGPNGINNGKFQYCRSEFAPQSVQWPGWPWHGSWRIASGA